MRVLVIFVVSCHMLIINGLDITVCKNGGNFPSVDLTCSNNNDIIHVENIKYFYNGSSDCSSSTVPCGNKQLTNSDTGLISSCTAQPSPCKQYIPNTGNCTESTVNYRCIPRENDQDMCQSQINLTENAGQLFLFSPQYPTTTTGFKPSENSCECVIRGSSITSITILDLLLKTAGDGTRSNLFIQYGDITYNKTSRKTPIPPLQVYNHRLQSTTTAADIIFTHQQMNGVKLWIGIQGLSLTGSCNKAVTNVSSTPSTPFTSTPQPDSTTTTGTSPSSTRTTTHTITTSTENNTDPSTSSESSTVHSTTVNNTDSSTTIHPSTSSETPTETSVLSSGSTSIKSTNPKDTLAQQTGNDNILLIVGCVVGGLVFTFILEAVCVLVGIRRKRANILQQNVHVHINNTTNNTVNNTTPNYFVLEGMNTQDVEVKHHDISTNPASVGTGHTPEYAVVNKTGRGFNMADVNKPDQATKSNETGRSDTYVLESLTTQDEEGKHDNISTNPSSMTTGCTPEYAVVNKTGRGFNVADVNKPDHATKSNATGVSDMEILENELYVPYEASNNQDDTGVVASITNNTKQHRPLGDMEILENELYISYEASNNQDDARAVVSTTNNVLQHGPSRDMEIMENDLYVPFEDSAVKVSKPMANSVYDNAVECGTQQDVAAPEIKIETTQGVATPAMEILENDLYVPFEDTDKVAYDNAHKVANKPRDQTPVMEILENDLYVPFEKTQE